MTVVAGRSMTTLRLGRVLQAVAVIAISGCTTASMFLNETKGGAFFSDPEPAPPGYATLVLFRDYGTTTTGFKVPFIINETPVADLGRTTYTYVYLKPGRTVVRYGGKENAAVDRTLAFGVTAGETYFLEHKFGQNTLGVIPPVVIYQTTIGFTFLQADAAKKELAECRYVKPAMQSM